MRLKLQVSEIRTSSLFLVIDEVANEDRAVGLCYSALASEHLVLPVALLHESVIEDEPPSPMDSVIFEVALVQLVSFLVREHAEAFDCLPV